MNRQWMTEEYGGNLVRRFGELTPGAALAHEPYDFRIVKLRSGVTHRVDRLATGAAWALDAPPDGVVFRRSGESVTIPMDGVALFDGVGVEIAAENGDATLLIAGTQESNPDRAHALEAHAPESLHRVAKPWGEELWINGRHPTHAFKRITLHGGQRTSLQYHELKRETNLLVRGYAALHYSSVSGHHDSPVRRVQIDAVSAIDVAPNVLHRIEAVTDITLFEVSTPHLDDVIRISDDTGRGDGLVASEHGDEASHIAHA